MTSNTAVFTPVILLTTLTDAKGVDIALAVLDNPISSSLERGGKPYLLSGDGEFSPMQGIYNAVFNGLPLALGKCNIGEETVISIFTFDPAKYQRVFTPLSELDYEFGKIHGFICTPKIPFGAYVSVRTRCLTWICKGQGRDLEA
jgi:hypothetical protein